MLIANIFYDSNSKGVRSCLDQFEELLQHY